MAHTTQGIDNTIVMGTLAWIHMPFVGMRVVFHCFMVKFVILVHSGTSCKILDSIAQRFIHEFLVRSLFPVICAAVG